MLNTHLDRMPSSGCVLNVCTLHLQTQFTENFWSPPPLFEFNTHKLHAMNSFFHSVAAYTPAWASSRVLGYSRK